MGLLLQLAALMILEDTKLSPNALYVRILDRQRVYARHSQLHIDEKRDHSMRASF